jgi:hypothetical protein
MGEGFADSGRGQARSVTFEEDDWGGGMHPDDVAEHETRLKHGAPDETGPTNIRRSGASELARLQAADRTRRRLGRTRITHRRAPQRARRTRAARPRPSQSATGDPPEPPPREGRRHGGDGLGVLS